MRERGYNARNIIQLYNQKIRHLQEIELSLLFFSHFLLLSILSINTDILFQSK